MQPIMTPEQVADYLQMNTDTIYRLIRSRKLPAAKIGRSYRIPKEDVEAFLVASSNNSALRETLFRRLMEIAKNNPGVSSDDVLKELEGIDEEKRKIRSPEEVARIMARTRELAKRNAKILKGWDSLKALREIRREN